MERKELSPPLLVGDKAVRVGALSSDGLYEIARILGSRDIPRPHLSTDRLEHFLSQSIPEAKDGDSTDAKEVAKEMVRAANMKIMLAIVDLLDQNMEMLFQLFAKSSELTGALLKHSTNLVDEDIKRMTASQVMLVLTIAWKAQRADGLFKKFSDFFVTVSSQQLGLGKEEERPWWEWGEQTTAA